MAREYKKCSVCKGELEYKVIYNFGDEALGVAFDWLECTVCGTKEKVEAD